MRFEHVVSVPAPRERVWALLMDVPRVARLVPGVDGVEQVGEDRYRGTLSVRLGPIRLALAGDVVVTGRDATAGMAAMRVEAADAQAGGGVRAHLALQVESEGETATRLRVTTDAQVFGRIGEFGQPVIRRKADEVMAAFAANVRRAVEAGP